MKKRVISAIAAILLLAAFTVSGAAAEGIDTDVSAVAAILYEPVTGTVLFEKNADDRMLIASTTKLMTALVALENCGLEETVRITAESVGVEGSSMYLKSGEELSMRELLYGLMLESGNDAAVAVAIHVSGSVEKFAQLMNRRAQSLGLENTHFVNPHGLNAEGHYSSARDLAVIMAEGMKNPLFAQIASTKSITFGARTFTNHNKLMWSYEGMVAGKTGYTKKAGRTLVTCAKRGDMTLICVTLKDGDDWNDHVKLYDAGFNGWELHNPVVEGQKAGRVPVISGVCQDVAVYPRRSLSVLTKRGSRVDVQTALPEFVYAGVKKGAFAGTVTVLVDGKAVDSAELVYARNVELDGSVRLSGIERIKRYFGGIN